MTLYALLLAVKLKVFAYMTPCLYVNKRFKMVRTAPQLPPHQLETRQSYSSRASTAVLGFGAAFARFSLAHGGSRSYSSIDLGVI